MKRKDLLIFLLFVLIISNVHAQKNNFSNIESRKFNPSTLLWYNQPATKWEEALPVGNGRLGTMVFGKTDEERIQLNENTYWTGGPYSTVVKGGAKMLPEIQKLIFEGKIFQANKLFGRYIMGYPVEQMKYQSLADLIILFDHKNVSDYKRWLDLENGIAGSECTFNGIKYRREVIASYPDQVIIIKLTTDKPGTLSFKVNLRGVRNQTHSNYATDYFRMDNYGDNGLILTGKSADYLGVEGKLKYEARIKVVNKGGTVNTDYENLYAANCDEVTIYFTAATNFINYKNVSGNPHQKVQTVFDKIKNKSCDELIASAVADYQLLFNRVKLKLHNTENSFLPTDKRITNAVNTIDPSLAALTYQFGRYLMISSSRPGSQPANLQGIWNQDQNPWWDSKYTTNINTEMNYWPVESSNLSECSEPLIKMIKELTDQGSQVAKEHYGCDGWVFHQNTDLWRVVAPMDGPLWGTFTVGGAWLTTHLWEHYLFTLDKNFLKEVYTVIKGSVKFFMDFLVQHPNGKWLVTNPSTSPENFPDGNGNKPFFEETTGSKLPGTTICYGSSIDMQILTDLFGYYIDAAKILDLDKDFVSKVLIAKSKLVPPQINKKGELQEWAEDFGQLEKQHRHLSHLYGLYPGNVFSLNKTPEFIDPIKAVLEQRGDGGAGWTRAWKIALWARLLDGNRCNKILKEYYKEQCLPQLFAKCFSAMQVDGSFGVTAGITEMLLQSNEGVINFLPALPEDWKDGEFKGIVARGAFEVSAKWSNSKFIDGAVFSKQGSKCNVIVNVPVKIICDGKEVKVNISKDGIIYFNTSKNKTYLISAQ
jgi:alpha-L-fucosidase 2